MLNSNHFLASPKILIARFMIHYYYFSEWQIVKLGAQWLSGRVLDLRPRGRGFEPHLHHCVVFLSKNINSNLVLVQPRKTCPFITERLLMGHKESKHTKQNSEAPEVQLSKILFFPYLSV